MFLMYPARPIPRKRKLRDSKTVRMQSLLSTSWKRFSVFTDLPQGYSTRSRPLSNFNLRALARLEKHLNQLPSGPLSRRSGYRGYNSMNQRLAIIILLWQLTGIYGKLELSGGWKGKGVSKGGQESDGQFFCRLPEAESSSRIKCRDRGRGRRATGEAEGGQG